jgi:glucokinase
MGLKPWSMVADIGGTNARFGIHDATTGGLHGIRRYSVADYANFDQVLTRFLSDVTEISEWLPLPERACFAVACPVDEAVIRFTNSPWRFSRKSLSELLGGGRVSLLNDFAAVGHAIPFLGLNDWQQIGGKKGCANRPIAVLGPGTGLGVCSLVSTEQGYLVVEGEGGHVDFAPVNEQEIAVLRYLQQQYQRVSVERLLSGRGIYALYMALSKIAGVNADCKTPEQVTRAALNGADGAAKEALSMFCDILGATAGNLALTLGAKGGVYIAGGIVPQLLGFLRDSNFRQRFEAKGRFEAYLAEVPIKVIVRENLGLMGAAALLRD